MLQLDVELRVLTESNYFNNVDLPAVSLSFDFWNKAQIRMITCISDFTVQ
jgi:hypothetical protein